MKRSIIIALAMVLALPSTILAATGYVKSLKLDEKRVTMEVWDTEDVDAKVRVKGNASTEVTAKSSNENIVTVDVHEDDDPDEYVVEITSEDKTGDAVVTVTTVDKARNGKKISKKIKVKVLEEVRDDDDDDDYDYDDD